LDSANGSTPQQHHHHHQPHCALDNTARLSPAAFDHTPTRHRTTCQRSIEAVSNLATARHHTTVESSKPSQAPRIKNKNMQIHRFQFSSTQILLQWIVHYQGTRSPLVPTQQPTSLFQPNHPSCIAPLFSR